MLRELEEGKKHFWMEIQHSHLTFVAGWCEIIHEVVEEIGKLDRVEREEKSR